MFQIVNLLPPSGTQTATDYMDKLVEEGWEVVCPVLNGSHVLFQKRTPGVVTNESLQCAYQIGYNDGADGFEYNENYLPAEYEGLRGQQQYDDQSKPYPPKSKRGDK